MKDDFSVWSGLYPDFASVPSEGPGFDGPEWVDILARRLEDARSAPGRPLVPTYQLPAVAAMAPGDGPLRILDFGGGVGATFLGLAAALEGARELDYHVVDSAAVCARGRGLHGNQKRLRFHGTLSEAGDRCGDALDIIHLGSTLQYIDDWRGLLSALAAMRPRYLLLSDVFAGSFDGYITCQQVYGSRIPVRFLNDGELVEAVESMGLRLIMRTPYVSQVLGRYGPLPMDNFPPELRLDHTSHFLFAR
jgi:putative methyltransferase (TIGR04325 family)